MNCNNKNNYGYLLALLAVIIWSGNFIAAKFLLNLNPIEISFYRWLITFILLTPFCIKKLIKNIIYIKGKWIKVIIISIIGITIFNTIVYLASHTTNATNLSLIAALSPIIIALISRIVWKTKLNINQKLGLIAVIIGIVILITKGRLEVIKELKFSLGDIYTLLAVIIFAVYSLSLNIKPMEMTQSAFFYLMVIIGLIPLIFLMLILRSNNGLHTIDIKSAIILIYIGVFPSTISFILWNTAISKIGAVKSGIIYASIPFFSSIEAVILLNEQLLLSQIISGILILIGIIYSSIGDKIKIKNNLFKKNKL